MAEKLVPGIPHATRMAILQQTDAESQDNNDTDDRTRSGIPDRRENKDRTVLEQAIGSDSSANDIIRKSNCEPRGCSRSEQKETHWADINECFDSIVLSTSFETDDPLRPVRAIRKIGHEKLEEELFLAQKNANLKSGVRGFQARKDLKVAEAKLEESRKLSVIL